MVGWCAWLLIAVVVCAAPALAQERTYLTLDEAIDRGLRSATDVRQRALTVTPELAERLTDEAGVGLLDSVYVFHEALVAGNVERSVVVLDVLGQYQPITMYVAIGGAGNVERVEIMVYRESRGSEVRRGAFLEQFADKSVADPVNPGGDIRNITGATISSRAVSRGVRLALRLHEFLAANE